MTPRSTMAVACSGFLALGIIIASLGPALPDLARATGAPLAALGGLLSLIFAGGLAAQLISGPLTDRLGSRPVLTGGLFLLGVGTLGIVLSHVTWLTFASAAILGLGHGTIGVSFSLLVARTFPQRTVSALNLLNLFFGVGAITGPAFASYLIRSVGSALPALWLGIAVVAAALPFCVRLPNQAEATGKAAPSSAGRLVGIPTFWLLGALLLTYVGVESGVAAWTTTYLQTVAGQSQAAGALLTSGFWGAVTAGRLVVTLIGGRFSPAALLYATLTGAAAGGLLLAFSGTSTVLITAAILVLGFFFAPVYPTGIALTTATFRQGSGTATSLVAAMASIGGSVIPALQGLVQDAAGPYQGMLLVTAGTLIMFVLSLILKQRKLSA